MKGSKSFFIFGLRLFVLAASGLFSSSLVSLVEQDTVSVCVLIQSEMQDWHESTQRYQELKARFETRCINLIENIINDHETHKILSEKIDDIVENKDKKNTVVHYENNSLKQETASPNIISSSVLALSHLPVVMYVPFCALLLVFISLISRKRLNQYRTKVLGEQGELRVVRLLKKGLKNKEYRLYSNLILPIDDTTFNTAPMTEVDLVLLTHFGVFVIEVKNYSGWIFGSKNQANWTQKLFTKRTSFKNPLHQNYKHCLAVAHCLGLVEGIYSVVVFAEKATFKTAMPENVVNESGLLDFLFKFKDKMHLGTENSLFIDEYHRFADLLDTVKLLSDSDAKARHLAQLKNHRYEPSISELTD